MGKFKLIDYTPEYDHSWDAFIEKSNNGTIFHRLDFLEYHGERFAGKTNHLIWLKGDRIYAVLPLAIFTDSGYKKAISPYGGSYGGIATREILSYSRANEIVTHLVDYLNRHDIDEIRLTFPIRSIYNQYSETFLFSLLESGFSNENSDISSVVEFHEEPDKLIKASVRNQYKKAVKHGIAHQLNAPIDHFWPPFEKTFQKHHKQPTHSYNELRWLHARFPQRIYFDVAYDKDMPVSGICHFILNGRADSSFYLCNDPNFQSFQSLTYLLVESLRNAYEKGFRCFDFGTSSVNMEGRGNLFHFKENFGAVGQFRNTYVWRRSRIA
jgi:hypothetical protein